MSDSLAPSEIVARPIAIGVAKAQHTIPDPAALIGESYMRPLLIVVAAWSLLCASPVFAQVEEPLTATPPLELTTPLGMNSSGSVGPAGIPLDASEVTSLGVSPAPTGGVTGTLAIPTSGAITTSGTTCSTVGASPAGMYGAATTYDGGGRAPGASTPASAAMTGSMGT